MNDEQRVHFLHFIIALAYSDGDLDPAERDYLKELIANAGFEDAAARKRVDAWLFQRPTEPDWDAVDPDFAHTLLRQAMLTSMLDMEVSQREMRYINGLRERLEIADAEFFAIQQEVERALVARLNK